jgi:hypothetical protein
MTVAELEKNLSLVLQKEQFLKLCFEKPQIDNYVIVPFTAQDFNAARKDKDSEYKLTTVIKRTLRNSNWRLMTEGVSYRLGYLSGRLKGYEREEDLLHLVKKSKIIKAVNVQ